MPEKTALYSGDYQVSYGELAKMIKRAEFALLSLGVKRGDNIILSAAMKWEYIAAFLAVKLIRAVAVPVLKTASAKEVSYIIERTESCLFFSDSPKYSEITNVHPYNSLFENDSANNSCIDKYCNEIIPDEEISEILFTSGTTSFPKGVMLSQSGLKASIKNTSIGMDMSIDDTLMLPLPLNHSFGLRVLRSALYNGETIVLQNGFSFAAEIKDKIEKYNCNCMVAVASGFQMLLEQMGDAYKSVFHTMKYIEFSAGAVPVTMRQKLVEDLPKVRLYNTWGSTETGGGLFLCFSEKKDKITSAGAAINDIVLGIADDDGKIHVDSYNASGRLALQSNAMMLGYYKDEQLTKQTISGKWLYTNDSAFMDKDGYIYLNGRIDDLISVGGEKVAPSAVERIVMEYMEVTDCVCIGVDDPDGILGQVPILFVVSNDKYQVKHLLEHIRIYGNNYMVPYSVVNIHEIPRNYMGKVDRKALYELWLHDNERNKKTRGFSDEVMELMLTRRSIRQFTDEPVDIEILKKLVHVAAMAPSGHNMQTWRFTVINNLGIIDRIKETTKKVAKEKKTLFYGFNNPSALIIVSNDRRNPDALQDSSAAIENILLLSHASNLGACWLNAWFTICDEPEIRAMMDEFKIPKTHIVHGIVGIGYPANTVKTPAKKENVAMFIE